MRLPIKSFISTSRVGVHNRNRFRFDFSPPLARRRVMIREKEARHR